ncbi:MAG: NAD(P)/FAD-dependent oxidoreductase [Pikeienuella sp.]
MTDVTILGAGIFGLSIAWMCQKKGARVRVIDPGGPGAGASGGIVGALAPHAPDNWNDKKTFQLESLLMARGFWAEVAEVSGISPGYGRVGRLQPIDDERMLSLSRARIETARTFWRGEAVWDVLRASDVPLAPLTATGFLAYDTLSARIHPRRACAALATAIAKKGGEVMTEGAHTGHVIHATGAAGLLELSETMGRAVGTGVKGQSALLDFAAPDMPQIFADGIHIIPHEDGSTAIGSTSESEFADPHTTDAQLDQVIERAMVAVPALRGAKVIERWAGLRPRARTRERAPVLGEHPVHAGQFIANGGFKIGFGIAPKVGEIMAELVLDQNNTIPANFRPGALL